MASTTGAPAFMSSGIPIFHPAHLDGDPTLATEILPGPPSIVSIQQSVLKRDPRKPSVAFSYLPPSDPGSTYSGLVHGTLIGHEPDVSILKRSRTATSRAQRASARQQNGAASAVETPADCEIPPSSILPVDSDPYSITVGDDSSISRSNSFQNMQEGPSTNASSRTKRKDKGKGKEMDLAAVRIKEEPKTVSLLPLEIQTTNLACTNLGNNDDHCSSCRSYGALVYCDGCPRAFHLWCLDPPMESVDEGDSRWFCPGCMIRKHPPRKPPPSLLSPLIHQIDTSIPTEFQLPEDIRSCFKDVTTGPRGTYVDSSETKQLRLNRFGEQEGRDPNRLKDRNGGPILCFRCGTSTLPDGVAAAVPSAKRARRSNVVTKKTTERGAWKNIISCDYCNLHWHLDCLDPPLSTLPSFTKKWMCPNHAEKVFPPKRRVPKQNAPPIEIYKGGRFNNGNIDIISAEPSRPIIVPPEPVDEVLINGRRYRIPERVIVLDFWNKLNKHEQAAERDSQVISGMSSPLTSLSSLDDLDEGSQNEGRESLRDKEDLKAAQALWSLQTSKTHNNIQRKFVENGVQADLIQLNQPESSVKARGRNVKLPTAAPPRRATTLVDSTKVSDKTPKPKPVSKLLTTNGPPRTIVTNDAATRLPEASVAKKRRRPAPVPIQRDPSTRELRSRSKNNVESSLTSISSRSSVKCGDESMDREIPVSAPLVPPFAPKPRPFQIKIEETETHLIPGPSLLPEVGPSSQTPAKPRPKLTGNPDIIRETKEKRGRKRKQRDDELPGYDGRGPIEASEKADFEKRGRKKVGNPRRNVGAPPGAVLVSPSTPLGNNALSGPPPPPLSTPATPTLKIRLPRMNISVTSVNGNTSNKL